jgi:hypothetical protein
MKWFTGWALAAGLALAATSANAQAVAPHEIGPARYSAGADDPYAPMSPERRGPSLLPAREVYTVLRDNGYSALGRPRQRGVFYTIAVTNRRGGEGRLVIDARDGTIVRFMPGVRVDAGLNDDPTAAPPRPPASVPHVASRGVPLPKAAPPHSNEPLAAKPAPEPAQQTAAVQAKPAEGSAPPQSPAPAVVQAKPAEPQILPTREMPKVQDLE